MRRRVSTRALFYVNLKKDVYKVRLAYDPQKLVSEALASP